MRSLRSRLKKLESRRVRNRVPRIVVRYEHPDGKVEINESRPPEGDDDETTEIRVQYVETPCLWNRNTRPVEGTEDDFGTKDERTHDESTK
jgi:hypothetical protein